MKRLALLQQTTSARRRSFCMAMLAALSLLAAPQMQAQFDGPTPPPTYGVNVHHPVTTDPAILYPANPQFYFLPGDLLVVRVLNSVPDLNFSVRVSLDGSITVPFVGNLQVVGLTLPQAETLISQRLSDAQMFNNAQVTIQVSEAPAHIATVVGVAHGTVPVVSSKSLYDVLAAVGGLPTEASNVVSIHRNGLAEPIVIDLGNDPSASTGSNIPVFSGDTITTGRVGSYYVVGAVRAPNAQVLSGSTPVTVLQALARAGGPVFEAKLDSALLIRTNGTQRSVMHVHLRAIEHGKAPDPVLQTDDILLIPSDPILAAIRNGGIGTALAIAVTLTYF